MWDQVLNLEYKFVDQIMRLNKIPIIGFSAKPRINKSTSCTDLYCR